MDLTFWTFHLPNLVLAALMYTLIGRVILGYLFRSKPDAVMLKVFAQVTDPAVRIVRVITPEVISNELVVALTFFWLLGLRMLLLIGTRLVGLAPVEIGT